MEIPKGRRPLFQALSRENLITEEEMEEFSAIEDVIMIGYPKGIMDFVNTEPVIRKGTTATHYFLDYDGDSDFLIDMVCFD